MNTTKWKLTLAGGLVAVALGGFLLGFAWATPGQGVTVTTIAGPADMGELDIDADLETHEIELQTSGQWVGRVVHHRIVPGGHTGWHSHPGPVFVMVTAGTLTKYDADDLDAPGVYPAGTGFVEGIGDVHIGVNEGKVDLEMISFLLTPKGWPTRIDEPDPRD